MTRAIVLAAGEGTRLRPFTLDRPKCLVPLAGRPLLDHQLTALHAAGVDDVTLVTGYRADQLVATGLPTVHNDRYDSTNMVASLMCARSRFDGADDVLIAYGDLVYEPRVIEALVACDRPLATTVDRRWRDLWELRMADPLADAETLQLDTDGNIVELGLPATSYDEIEGQYMGLTRVSARMAPELVAVFDALGEELGAQARDAMYMTAFLQHLIDHVAPVAAVIVEGGWLEVDTVEDLETYERLRAAGQLDRFVALT
jgi:choline kinase